MLVLLFLLSRIRDRTSTYTSFIHRNNIYGQIISIFILKLINCLFYTKKKHFLHEPSLISAFSFYQTGIVARLPRENDVAQIVLSLGRA